MLYWSLFACSAPDVPPRVEWAYPNASLANDDTKFCPWFEATVDADRLDIVPAGNVKEGEGHWHLEFTGVAAPELIVQEQTADLYEDLVLAHGVLLKGEVELRAWLVDNAHKSILDGEDEIDDIVSISVASYDEAGLAAIVESPPSDTGAGSLDEYLSQPENEELRDCEGWSGIDDVLSPPEQD